MNKWREKIVLDAVPLSQVAWCNQGGSHVYQLLLFWCKFIDGFWKWLIPLMYQRKCAFTSLGTFITLFSKCIIPITCRVLFSTVYVLDYLCWHILKLWAIMCESLIHMLSMTLHRFLLEQQQQQLLLVLLQDCLHIRGLICHQVLKGWDRYMEAYLMVKLLMS